MVYLESVIKLALTPKTDLFGYHMEKKNKMNCYTGPFKWMYGDSLRVIFHTPFGLRLQDVWQTIPCISLHTLD